jgi:O-antigen/teichoic acid export membrane protein
MPIKRNLVANFVASFWSAAISLLLVPLYVRLIGIEAYGLVGIYGTLQAMASLLDMGFTTTMNREMARVSTSPDDNGEARTLVRTMEVFYWAIALLIGAVVILFAPFLASHWFTGVTLSAEAIEQALVLIGLSMLLQWPFSFYSGGLMGLQRQVLLSGVQIGMGTLRGVGAILILWLVSPTIQAFFGWQIAISALSTFIVAFLLWHSLPPSTEAPRFRTKHLQKVWRFAAGISAISALGLLLVLTDKIVLSRLLTLEEFGYYTLAGVVAASLYLLINPVYNAVFPRLTQLVTLGDQTSIARFYHQSAQVMSVALIPTVVMLALLSRQILFIWTGSPITAANTYQLVALLAIGTGLHGLSHVPWALQLAHGWTRLGFYVNLCAVSVLVPLVIVLALRYGATGGAAGWAILSVLYVAINVSVMHRRLLKGELRGWCIVDVGRTAGIALLVTAVARFFIPDTLVASRLATALFLGIVWSCSTILAAVAALYIRPWILLGMDQIWRHSKILRGVKNGLPRA